MVRLKERYAKLYITRLAKFMLDNMDNTNLPQNVSYGIDLLDCVMCGDCNEDIRGKKVGNVMYESTRQG